MNSALKDDVVQRAPMIAVIGVLGGAATFSVDLGRALDTTIEVGWMAGRSYTTGVRSSGSVRLLKDLDLDIAGRDVLIVDTVIDTGLTLSWLIANLRQRGPASIAVCALMRKPDAKQFEGTPTYVGSDVPAGLVVGYGLDPRQIPQPALRSGAGPACLPHRQRLTSYVATVSADFDPIRRGIDPV